MSNHSTAASHSIVPCLRRTRHGWTLRIRVLGVTHRYDRASLVECARAAWRQALCPAALRRRRRGLAFYRSGWSKDAFEELHGPINR